MKKLSELVPVKAPAKNGKIREKRYEAWNKEFISFLKNFGWVEVDDASKIKDRNKSIAVEIVIDEYDDEANPFCLTQQNSPFIFYGSSVNGIYLDYYDAITPDFLNRSYLLSIDKERAEHIVFDDINNMLIIKDLIAIRLIQ